MKVFIGLLGMAFLMMNSITSAAEFKINSVSQPIVGNARTVDASGPYSLAKNESVVGFYLEYLITGSNVPASAMGTFNPTTMTWRVNAGDYQMRAFRIRMDVRNGKTTSKIVSPYSPWTGK